MVPLFHGPPFIFIFIRPLHIYSRRPTVCLTCNKNIQPDNWEVCTGTTYPVCMAAVTRPGGNCL